MDALLIFGKLLAENVREGVVEAALLKVRARDARRVRLRGEIVDLPKLGPILRDNDGSGVTDVAFLCCTGGGEKRRAHGKQHGADGDESFHKWMSSSYIYIVGSMGAVGAACWESAIFFVISCRASW